jgi:nucleoside-diphosphate-sugar epimerase
MRRVVVTGAKGGTGRSIVKVLRAAGYDVLGIDIKPVEDSGVGYVQADLMSDHGLHDLLAGAWGVVHFGSVPTDAFTSRTETFRNVMLGGFNIFQACANLGIKRIAHASSIMVYGNLEQQPFLPVIEQSPLVPFEIYGSSKVMLERAASDMCRWYDLSIAAFRLGRIVYEGCFDQRLKRHTESDASAVDSLWCYVDARDVAKACQLWLESDIKGFRVFNLAADDVCVETPTRELLQKYYSHVHDIRADFEGHRGPFDASALKSTLGWKPQYNWRAIRDGA